MRDIKSIVLAEDDKDRQNELRQYLERLGGYSVAATDRVYDVIRLVGETNARWVILDLELIDGVAIDIIKPLKEKYGRGIFILILTGYWERYSENKLIRLGADLVLRKAYDPEALVQQLRRIQCGWQPTKGETGRIVGVGICGGKIDIGNGTFVRAGQKIQLTSLQMLLIETLVNARVEGIPRVALGDLCVQMYGEDAQKDIKGAGARLRSVVYRLRKILDCPDFLDWIRESNNASYYLLNSDAVLIKE